MRNFLLAATAILAGCGAQPAAKAQLVPVANAPKLVIVISIDQLSSDLFETYRPLFTGGMAKLLRGTVFANGYQGHASTETCPGHSTLLTGNMPTHTGIVANGWYDETVSRNDKQIYCVEDVTHPGSSYSNYKVSPVHLRGTTLGDMLKTASPASRVVAVAGKDRSAVMMGGRNPDQRWYWNRIRFETDGTGEPPRSVRLVNQAVAMMIAAPQAGLEPPPACVAKSKVYAMEGSGRQVGNGRFERGAADVSAFRASPALDGATLALAAGLVGEMNLGRGTATDLLAISLAATDLVGHSKGIGGQEMCLQLLSLDRDLGDFFRQLDGSGINYSVVLTADHGSTDIPERMRDNGHPDYIRIDPKLNATEVGNQLARQLNLPKVEVIGYSAGDIFVGRNLGLPDRARAVSAAKKLFADHPHIEAVFTKADVANLPLPSGTPDKWTLAQRVRASFDPVRSGDLFVVQKSHVVPVPDTRTYAVGHGSPWDYDRRVPIIFWRPGMTPANRPDVISTIDIMPTLAAMLGVSLSGVRIDGHCLGQVQVVFCPR